MSPHDKLAAVLGCAVAFYALALAARLGAWMHG